MHPTINFLSCKTNQSKIASIVNIIERSYKDKKAIQVVVPNKQAEKFLSETLWKFKHESFLPHHLTDEQTLELIVITLKNENLNHSKILLNLCSDPSPIADQFETVYELYDETFPDKLNLSKKRRQHYVEMGYTIKDIF